MFRNLHGVEVCRQSAVEAQHVVVWINRFSVQARMHAAELVRDLNLSCSGASAEGAGAGAGSGSGATPPVDLIMFVGGDGTLYEGLQVSAKIRGADLHDVDLARCGPARCTLCGSRGLHTSTLGLKPPPAPLLNPQGLFQRPDWEAAVQCPMAAVPCGSGNGLAASAGLWDPVTAVVSVCRGRTEPVDVASVLQPPGNRFYCLLSVVYGSMVRLADLWRVVWARQKQCRSVRALWQDCWCPIGREHAEHTNIVLIQWHDLALSTLPQQANLDIGTQHLR